ncbi:MAG: trypsin-like peptidase domain-containing protein [Deltaproteobacteria bacterium]|nr:trypsin-like peptidase domain-containing protein [Deltaproteobacteria bacterium]
MKNSPGKKRLNLIILSILIYWGALTSYCEAIVPGDDKIRKKIVKIYASQSSPDYLNPWRSGAATQVSGSGCIVEGNRILTNAHVVANSTYLEVRLHGSSKRYKAKALKVAHEVDIALLEVEDESIFAGISPLKLGKLPEAQQEVLVYGFPIGGDSLSITKGILSRIEHQSYVHSGDYFLAGQIDAAINPGNSGGPVIVDGKIAGIVMQSYSPLHSENLGYMVPAPVIRHFFEDLEDGEYEGFPALGLHTQNIENPAMKEKYSMNKNRTGVVINHIYFKSPAQGRLKVNDIVMAVDGHAIADDGTVEFRPGERTFYSYFIEMHQMNEKVEVDILRKGKIKKFTFKLRNEKDDLMLVRNMKEKNLPRYFVFGGIVFTPLTKNLVQQWGRGWRRRVDEELLYEISNWPSKEKKEVVVALKVLAADLNRGYHKIRNWAVEEVNGKKFANFDEFINIISREKEPFIEFKNRKGYRIVIDRLKAGKDKESILKTYRIKEDRSPDLK